MTPRSLVVAALAVSFAVSLAACSGVQTVDTKDVPTATIEELQSSPEKFNVKPNGPLGPVIVKVPKGTKLPLTLNVDVDFASLEPGDNVLVFDRDVYIYMAPKMAMMSPDGISWAPFGDWGAVKELFGLEGGSFSVGFGVSKEKGAMATMGVKAQ